MNVVFVGGGSYRTLPVVRAAMQDRTLFQGGSIRLVDFNLARAEMVGRMIQKTPEYAAVRCPVTWTDKIERALPGADMVSVSFPVGGFATCRLSEQACVKRGVFGSDQISVSGAFRSLTGGAILLNIARAVEKYAPKAWLVDFANPVAVYSGMVNNHTRVRALGICAGFANHRWDLTRTLLDKDEYCEEWKVTSAGVNHIAFILRGTYHGRDLYKMMERCHKPGWKPPRITSYPKAEKGIHYGLWKLVECHRRFGKTIFSTEGDGMEHLFFEEMFAQQKKEKPLSASQIAKRAAAAAKERDAIDREFRRHLNLDLDAKFWNESFVTNPHYAANPGDPTVLILRALSGKRQWLAASLPNRGAVRGFKDRTVLEYSMHLDAKGVHPEPDLEVPDCFHGLISSLATHQTLLGDAIATKDPKIFAQALFAYPIYQNTKQMKELWKDLLAVHAKEIDPVFQKAKAYF